MKVDFPLSKRSLAGGIQGIDGAPAHPEQNEKSQEGEHFQLFQGAPAGDNAPAHGERVETIGQMVRDAEGAKEVDNEGGSVVRHLFGDVSKTFRMAENKARLKFGEPDMSAQKSKDTKGRQALEEEFPVGEIFVRPDVHPRGAHSGKAPKGVDQKGSENDEAGGEFGNGVGVVGDGRFPSFGASKRGQVVPQMEDGPHAEGCDGKERAKA